MGLGFALLGIIETFDLIGFITKNFRAKNTTRTLANWLLVFLYTCSGIAFAMTFFDGVTVWNVLGTAFFCWVVGIRLLVMIPAEDKKRFHQWLRLPLWGFLAFVGIAAFKVLTPIYWDMLVSTINSFISSVF